MIYFVSQERSRQLSAQISAQFEEMHQFLKKKEEEVKKTLEKEEKDMIEKMKRNRAEIEEKLNDGKEKEGILHSVFETDQPVGFLQVQTNHCIQHSTFFLIKNLVNINAAGQHGNSLPQI